MDTAGLRHSDAAREVVGHRFAEVQAGGRPRLFRQPAGFSCGIEEDRLAILCWGWYLGADGEVGWTPRSVAGLPPSTTFRALTTGTAHACALSEEGEAFCWGDNTFGQLGDGTRSARSDAAPVAGGRTFDVLSAGEDYTCGIAHVRLDLASSTVEGRQGGEILCWGDNRYGQLGDGTTEGRLSPVRVVEPGSS